MSHIPTDGLFFLFSVSLKALGLFCLAAVSLALLRLRDANIRHRVWTGVLAGMLLLPLLALVLPSITLAIPWPFESSSTGTRSVVPTSPTASSEDNSARSNMRSIDLRQADEGLLSDAEGFPSEARRPAAAANDAPALTTAPIPAPGVVASVDYMRIGATVMLFSWALIAFVFVIRLVVGLWLSQRLINRAWLASEPCINLALARLPEGVRDAGVEIRESDEVVVPVTGGWLRAVVLLPTEWTTWSDQKLTAVLAHELTHVARRDFCVYLAAELNGCVYWFHPVSWWLRRRLSDLAEAACDDAVIGCTGDPAGYARHLLEVAASLSGRSGRLQPGLAMARESNVAGRISAVLDSNRERSRRLGWRGATAISAIALVTVATAAALRPVRALESAATPPEVLSESAEMVGNLPVRVRGRVSDEQGAAIPGVRVRLYRVSRSQYYAANDDAELVKELELDRHGNFDDSIPREQLLLTDDYGFWNVLVASAPNFAYSVLVGNPGVPIVDGKPVKEPDFMKDRVEFRLQPHVPIRGRVLSIEGQPVPGATVSIYQLLRADATRLDEWLAKAATSPPRDAGEMRRMTSLGGPPAKGTFFPHNGYLHLPIESTPEVQTDERGEFQLRNLITENDLVILRIRGPGITDSTIHVLGRDQATVYARHITRISRYGAYYGRNFSYVAQPSVPVFGVVRDIETKEPLRNVSVAVGGVYGTTMSHTGYVVTRTDDQGRYRIEGLPIPPVGTRNHERNSLSIRPGKLPYIENDSIPIPRGDGVNPVEFNVELRRAVMAKGRITDMVTGKPVLAELHYSPFLTNSHNDEYLRYGDGTTTFIGNDSRYRTDEDGYFEIPVIPGRGVLAAKCPQGGYITAFGADEIPELQEQVGSNRAPVTSDHVVPSLFHSVKLLDVPADAVEYSVDLPVDPGTSLTVRFVGPDGEPVSDVGCRGLGTDRRWKVVKEDHAEVTSLAVGKIRAMFFRHEETQLQRLVRLTPEEEQTEFEVRLLPATHLRGRLTDPEGRPLANVTVEARHQNDPDFMGSLQQIHTDEDGRFEYLLPVGASFTVIGQTDKYFRVVEELENERPQNIDLGDLVVDPDAERWAPVKAKRDPVITDLAAK